MQIIIGAAKLKYKNLFKEIVKPLYLYHHNSHYNPKKSWVTNKKSRVLHKLNFFLVI